MSSAVLAPQPAGATAFKVFSVSDARGFESLWHAGSRAPDSSHSYVYRLRDAALRRTRFDRPILSLGIRSAGDILACHGANHLATDIRYEGRDSEFVGFTTVLQGTMGLAEGGVATTVGADRGLAFCPRSQTRILISDGSVRTNVFLRVSELEAALEHMLDDRLPGKLHFRPAIDWSRGLAPGLQRQLAFVMEDFGRPDGIAANPVALAALTDLLVTLALRALPHNHTDRLAAGADAAVPHYVQRAEAFMQAHGAKPLRIADIATAAGCSVRTLGAAFRRFRGITPLAALHAARLDQVHAQLRLGAAEEEGASIGTVARRYGFTNASRFAAAFRRRFNETPAEIARQGGRRHGRR
jgi:AraC-like DNA-binding protein